jgi:hypothetical protein
MNFNSRGGALILTASVMVAGSLAFANAPVTNTSEIDRTRTRVAYNGKDHMGIDSLRFSNTVGQHYFWTDKWQLGERAADHDLRSGNFEEFDSASDAVSWIFSDEE